MLEEEERLTQLMHFQHQQIEADVQAIKIELEPVTKLGNTLKKFLTRKTNQGIAWLSVKVLVDGLIKNVILSRSGWFTRIAVPFFLKNFASHLAEEPEKLVRKIKHMFGKNGKVVRPE
jgi:hypothetical protein